VSGGEVDRVVRSRKSEAVSHPGVLVGLSGEPEANAGGLITHRVHALTSSGLETKGDANRKPDAWTVQRERVVGLVSFGITGGGYVLVFLQQPTGVPSLVLLAMSAMFAWALFFPAQQADPLTA
jgi:hypothetical protein